MVVNIYSAMHVQHKVDKNFAHKFFTPQSLWHSR